MNSSSPSVEPRDAEDAPGRDSQVPSGPNRGSAAESAASERASKRRALLALGVLIASFLAYSAFAVPRLSNNLLSDTEFTGWSGPIAWRIVNGQHLYSDLLLPIPPGSFLILALIQKFAGRALLLQELWLAALAHGCLALLSYAMVRPLTTRLNALLVSVATLLLLLQIHKEIAYDHTAQLAAWGSITLGVRALLSPPGTRRGWLWVLTGFLATFTSAFKQSTGSGLLGGWLFAFGYLVSVEHFSRRPLARRSRLVELVFFALGGVMGVGGLILLLGLSGSPLSGYWQNVFVDAAPLKGGSGRLAFNVFSYIFRYDAYPASLFFTLGVALLFVRLSRNGGFGLGDLVGRDQPLSWTSVGALMTAIAGTFGVGVLLLHTRTDLWDPLVFWTTKLQLLPSFGLLFACVHAAAHLRRIPQAAAFAAEGALGRGHAINALLLVALSSSLSHNLSFPGFRPFYDNNPIIPLAFWLLFATLERARFHKLKLASFALTLLVLFGPKYERFLAATVKIGRYGNWAGLRVSEQGREVVRAAVRVRELASASETVLVLPEDLELAALIDRPRPPIHGAVVFVDQYPKRLVEADLKILEQNLPKVVVIHPREDKLWRNMYELWSSDSGAQQVAERFLKKLLPRYYVRDSSYDTRFARTPAKLDVWVRKPGVTRAD